MNNWTRRAFLAGAAGSVAACGNGIGDSRGARIDYRVDLALQQMFDEVPGSRDLADRAAGMLVMPTVTKAGFGWGGAYGEGALLIGNAPVDYYSIAQGSWGFQLGLQQFAHTVFFMNQEALANFRNSAGWEIGADAEYVFKDDGDNLGTDTTRLRSPVIAVIYGRAGLHVGATLEGTKYSRIRR
ncbi:MAG: lipid-binding SYLF domain-containing protein [Rhodobacteraceae bacterium]|nr:lipid-binding SYLF domain-containing protein [Paracoccaceae bacterium]MCB1367364.1 lipid-binding SYLF domain-containing protein [Paracoccaceae bacterium]